MAAPDLARIKGNVAKMAAQKAPEADIDGYIASEGVTIDDVRNFKPQAQGAQPENLGDQTTFSMRNPPATLPSEAGLKRTPDGKIDVLDLLQKQTKTGPYAPPTPQPDLTHNPLASRLPGVLGQAQNTFTAASRGGLGASLGNLGEEAFAGAATIPKVVMDLTQGRGFDPGRAFQEELGLAEKSNADARDLNPAAYGTGATVGAFGMLGKAKGAPMEAIPAITPGAATKAALSGAAVGAATGFGEPGSVEDRLKNALANGAFGALVGGVGGKLASGATREMAPTAQELKTAYKGAFKAAEDTGAVIGQKSVSQYAQDAVELLKSEGVVTPSGKVAGFPKVAHAINMMDDFAGGNMSIAQAQTLRKAVAGAAKSIDSEERYVGVQMLDHFDRFVANLKPSEFVAGNGQAAVTAWTQGRAFYQVAKKGQAVTDLISSASRQAKKSAHVSGEQAIRNKFDAFVGKAKNLRGFSPAEVAQLEQVGNGTPVGNVAKAAGKLAPTTLGGIGVKAGIPFAVGSAVGGPAVGTTLAGATMGVGVAGRIISRLSTGHQAELARVMVMNGGKLPKRIPNGLPAEVKKALGNLMLVAPELSSIGQRPAQSIATPIP